MARVFNIYFTYDGSMHNAVVSVRTTPFFTEYLLSNYDEALYDLLPGNRILSTGPDHFTFQNAGTEHSSELMHEIIRAVCEHLQVSQA